MLTVEQELKELGFENGVTQQEIEETWLEHERTRLRNEEEIKLLRQKIEEQCKELDALRRTRASVREKIMTDCEKIIDVLVKKPELRPRLEPILNRFMTFYNSF